jgi:hypothetical protein
VYRWKCIQIGVIDEWMIGHMDGEMCGGVDGRKYG